MFDFQRKLTTTFSAAALIAGVAMAAPSFAASTDAAQAANQAAPAKMRNRGDVLDARIKDLHDKLQITESQAGQWDAVAKTMRGNAKVIGDLVKDKRKNEQTMTAVEDLEAYQEIAEAHAKGAKKLTAAFDVLYRTMSDDQKKIADAVFRQHKADAMASAH